MRSSRSLSPAKSPLSRGPSVDKVGDTRDDTIRQLEEQIKCLTEKLAAQDENITNLNGNNDNDEDENIIVDDENDNGDDNSVDNDDEDISPMCIFTSMRAHQVDHYEQQEEESD